MGPSVKFVLPIIDAFPDKKMGVIFCVAKKDKPGGGGGAGGGGLSLGRTFSRHSFLNDSLISVTKCLLYVAKHVSHIVQFMPQKHS